MGLTFKTKPFPHQARELEISRGMLTRCLWWEMGLGKSWVVIVTAADLFLREEIDGLFILAPNGVHKNWALDEIPAHMPDDARAKLFLWETKKRKTKRFQAAFSEFMETKDGLSVLVMSYNSLMTDDGAKAAKQFLVNRRCLFAADETTVIKTPGAKVTKRTLAASKYAKYRRVLNGTPVADKPFDVYTQVRFADPGAWWRLCGIRTFAEFRAFFGVWQMVHLGRDRKFQQLVEFRNLDKMNAVLDAVGSRLTKDDELSLPPKIYSKIYFDLSPEQRKIYNELVEEYKSFLSGMEITTSLAIVRMMRLQQVASGYIPVDADVEACETSPKPRLIGNTKPRIDALLSVTRRVRRQAIIWAKFSMDIDLIAEALKSEGESFVIYDGRTPENDRLKARQDFQAGKVKFFLSKPSCAGRGLTLHAADTVIYYNNTFSLEDRQQSEDRAHRIGQTRAVNYIDIIASNSLDGYILRRLREKKNVAAIVTGDEMKRWV